MGVKVRDLKGDGNAWIVVYSGKKRTQRKIGDWDKARSLAEEIEAEQLRIRLGLPEPLPLSRVLADHRDGYVTTLKHSTQVLQRGQINRHLIPELGEYDARNLSESHVVAFAEKKLKTLSPSFVRGCVNVLRKAHRRLRREYPEVPRLDLEIAELFDRAEDSRAEEIRAIDSWTHDEASQLLATVHAKEPRWYPLVLTLLHTGCRRGEALGMRWSDVDFERKRITIRRARVNSRTVLPKHRRRRDKPRTVVITPAMEMALRGLQTFRHRSSGGWVFASRNGTPVEETTTYRTWVRICGHLAKRGIRTLTMHSLRHTFATLSLESGKSVKWIAQQLGHRDATLTLNTYTHALPDEEADLSYLPNLGAGADQRWTGASTKLKSVASRVSA